MGNWTCLNVSYSTQDINNNFGNTFQVRFRLKYSTSIFSSFKEPPTLEWKEIIKLLDHNKGEWWQFTTDQYERLPRSMTLKVWGERYIKAYESVWYQDPPNSQVNLYALNGQKLLKNIFGNTQKKNDREKADAVRSYLKQNGAILEIEIIDTPALIKPKQGNVVNKERLLIFDCGLKGVGQRVKGYQYLKVDSSVDQSQWIREVVYSTITRPIDVSGLTQTDPPPDVTKVDKAVAEPEHGYYP